MPDTKSSQELPKGYKLGEYLIESVLGHGGFGITYLAHDTQLSSLVAIKEFFPRSVSERGDKYTIRPFTNGAEDFRWGLQEFLKEARALAKFKHNHIVRVLRFVEANNTAYMVMEYEQGESLDVYLKRSGGYLNEQMLLSVFIPVLNGLQAVHDAGLLHLDIKPDNIYLRSNGQPMLIDFGSSRHAKGESESGGKIALTPAFSAIEQYPGIGDKGPWTDVYSMGATLYRCVIGQSPADSFKRYQAVQSKTDDPYILASVYDRPIFSQHIRESIDTAMHLMAEDRPQTADLLQRALMGQRFSEAAGKNRKRPSGNYRPDLIPDVGTPMTVVRKEKTRGFFEQLFFFMVLAPALFVFAIQLSIQFDVLSEEEVFSRFDGIKNKTTAKIISTVDSLDATLYKNLRIRIKQQDKSASALEVAVVDAGETIEKAQPVLPFDINKTVSKTLVGHRDEIIALAFLQGGNALASLSGEGDLRLWNTVSGVAMHKLGAGRQIVGAIDGSGDGKLLAWTIGGTAYIHEIENNKEVARLEKHDGNIRHIRYSPKGDLLATVTDNKTLFVWNTSTWQVTYQKQDLKWDTNAVEFSQNGQLLALSNSNGEIKIYLAVNGAEINSFFSKAEGEEMLALAYSPDGNWLASSGPEKFLKLWDTGIDRKDKNIIDLDGSLKKLKFSSDSKWLLATGEDGSVKIWDVNKGEMIKTLKAPHDTITSFAVSSRGDVIAVGGSDHKISLWR